MNQTRGSTCILLFRIQT